MDMQEIDNLRALLPAGRTVFSYFKDKYSFQLLAYALPQPTPVATLRQHPAAQLLHKPALKTVLAECGGVLDRSRLMLAPAARCPEHYTLSLAAWGAVGRAAQTTRRGANLVLQLNFNHAHNRAFERLVQPLAGVDPFNYDGHPAVQGETGGRRYTLAWARLDIDFERGEALVEEVQTDWLRRAARVRDDALCLSAAQFALRYRRVLAGAPADVVAYHDRVLAPHRAWWDEALLAAVLFFLREELGMRDIWMHSARSGVVLKNIRPDAAPPVSLYTRLPQRFCFRPSAGLPGFLADDRRVVRCLRRVPDAPLFKFAL